MREAIVFETLWRPRLLKWWPRDYLFAVATVCPVAMVLSGRAWVGFSLAFIALLYGWIRAKNDPEFFSIWVQKLRLGKTKQANSKSGNEYKHG